MSCFPTGLSDKPSVRLPKIDAGEVYMPETDSIVREIFRKKIKERIKQSTPGGTWQDWDPELRALHVTKCLREKLTNRFMDVWSGMNHRRQ